MHEEKENIAGGWTFRSAANFAHPHYASPPLFCSAGFALEATFSRMQFGRNLDAKPRRLVFERVFSLDHSGLLISPILLTPALDYETISMSAVGTWRCHAQ
jgi:hypothetical protein